MDRRMQEAQIERERRIEDRIGVVENLTLKVEYGKMEKN
jgi:hypothetical protein